MLFTKTILIADADHASLDKALHELTYFGMVSLAEALEIRLVPPGALSNDFPSETKTLGKDWNKLNQTKFKVKEVKLKKGERFGGSEIEITFEVWHETAYKLLEESGLTSLFLIGNYELEFDAGMYVKKFSKIYGVGYGINNLTDSYELNFGKSTVYSLPANVANLLTTGELDDEFTSETITLINIPNKYGNLNQHIAPSDVFGIAEKLIDLSINDIGGQRRSELLDGLETLNRAIRKIGE